MHLSNTPNLPHIQLNMNRGKHTTMSNFQQQFTHLHSPWMPLLPVLMRKTRNNQKFHFSYHVSVLHYTKALWKTYLHLSSHSSPTILSWTCLIQEIQDFLQTTSTKLLLSRSSMTSTLLHPKVNSQSWLHFTYQQHRIQIIILKILCSLHSQNTTPHIFLFS